MQILSVSLPRFLTSLIFHTHTKKKNNTYSHHINSLPITKKEKTQNNKQFSLLKKHLFHLGWYTTSTPCKHPLPKWIETFQHTSSPEVEEVDSFIPYKGNTWPAHTPPDEWFMNVSPRPSRLGLLLNFGIAGAFYALLVSRGCQLSFFSIVSSFFSYLV